MTVGELKKYLKKNKCKLFRHGSRHDIWINQNGDMFAVPRHNSQEVKKGTKEKILKEAGLKGEI